MGVYVLQPNPFTDFMPRFGRNLVELQTIAGERLKEATKAEAPERTGFLKSTINVVSLDGGTAFAVTIDAPYAFWVIFGTLRTAPNPFPQRAMDQLTPWYLNECRFLTERAMTGR